jgi:hypothetical protein
MEIANVRKGVRGAMARARREASERRARTDQASRAFDTFLDHVAIPLVRQIANVLRADGYLFSVFTPSGSVRLMSDRATEDFVEISLDATGPAPCVTGRSSWSRGRRVVEAEQVVGSGDPQTISEAELFAFLLKAIEPFIEK